MLCLAHF